MPSHSSSQVLADIAAASALFSHCRISSAVLTPQHGCHCVFPLCRSTNTSPGAPSQSGASLRQAILARSASQALAAKAAASTLKSQSNGQSSLEDGSSLTPKPSAALTPQRSLQLTPVSAMAPGHATHTYTPGSFVHSPSLNREVEEVGAEDLEVAGVTLHCSPPLAQGEMMLALLGLTQCAHELMLTYNCSENDVPVA